MKKIKNIFENIIGLISILSIIGIIVFGFIDNFSMFFLSTTLAIISLPWTLNNKDKTRVYIEISNGNKDNLKDLLEKYANKFIIPLVFVGWLYLLNRFVDLPVIAFHIELVWGLYIFGFIIISVYGLFKNRKTNSEKFE